MQSKPNHTVSLLDSVTTTVTGQRFYLGETNVYSLHAIVTGSGALTAYIRLDVSNDGVHWLPNAVEFSLSGTDEVQDGASITLSYAYVRARVTALTGTGATASLILGVTP